MSDDCGFLDKGHPLWREDGSVIYLYNCFWALPEQSISGHTVLSHLRLLPTSRARSRIYIPQEQGGPVIPLDTGFPFCRFLRLAGLRWRYSIPPAHGDTHTDTQAFLQYDKKSIKTTHSTTFLFFYTEDTFLPNRCPSATGSKMMSKCLRLLSLKSTEKNLSYITFRKYMDCEGAKH
jgi:hypothetical protein